jgi:DNA replication and repair protein RecF
MLARHGAELMYARIHLLKELEEQAGPIHQQLTRGTEILRLQYKPSYEPAPAPKGQLALPVQTAVDRSHLSPTDIEAGLRTALHAGYREDISRGMTTLGPHRDEFRFIGSGIDLGDYGSRGQGRTALLSLKFAEVQWMRTKTGEWPVLLLDEIMAELDPERRADLLAVLGQVEQALLTSTDPDMFPAEFTHNHEVWHVRDGLVYQN